MLEIPWIPWFPVPVSHECAWITAIAEAMAHAEANNHFNLMDRLVRSTQSVVADVGLEVFLKAEDSMWHQV